MKDAYYYKRIPRSRIATFDTFAVGLQKHHISGLLEFDVTDSRKKLQGLRKSGINVSFNAWIIKVISSALQEHPEASAFISGKRKLVIFNDINISILVEKKIGDQKVPIPVVIEKANEKSASDITREIENAKNKALSSEDVVINKPPGFFERLYYRLPGSLRRSAWKFILGNPMIAYPRMGNAVVTSIGMMGRINGWFIHRSIHPVSFGIGSILKKPVVIDNEVRIREILNMTILIDHDVIDGAPMVRFVNDLTRFVETGKFIDSPDA